MIEHIWTGTDNARTAVARRQVGGLGVKDYSGRQPNQEQLENVVCKSDPKPGFSFILDNFAELLDDTFLQNLTSTICQGKHTLAATQTHRYILFLVAFWKSITEPRLTCCFCLVQIRGARTTNAPVSLFLFELRRSSDCCQPL